MSLLTGMLGAELGSLIEDYALLTTKLILQPLTYTIIVYTHICVYMFIPHINPRRIPINMFDDIHSLLTYTTIVYTHIYVYMCISCINPLRIPYVFDIYSLLLTYVTICIYTYICAYISYCINPLRIPYDVFDIYSLLT